MSVTKHRITWWGVIPGAAADGAVPAPDEAANTHVHGRDFRVRRNARMNGRDWGWDATCSCGWDSRIGGGTQAAVRRAIGDHKWDVAYEANRTEADAIMADRSVPFADRMGRVAALVAEAVAS